MPNKTPFVITSPPTQDRSPNGLLFSLVGDYPGRAQVVEGQYSGGGNNSRFIGRSGGNLGMRLAQWPVKNPSPVGAATNAPTPSVYEFDNTGDI